MLQNIQELVFNPTLLKLWVVVIIILVGILIGKLAGRVVKRLAKEIELNKIIKNLLNLNLPVDSLLSKLVSWLIYIITVIFALDQVGYGSATLNIILIFILVIIVILVLFSVKDFIPNIIAGFIIYAKGNLKKGVKIKINNFTGTISSISLLETKIKTKKETIFIPNSVLIKNSIIIKD